MSEATLEAATPTPINEEWVRPLNRSFDRCDRCGAEAFFRVVIMTLDKPTGSDLLFCGHHFFSNEVKLREQAVHVHDEYSKINTKPSVSANAD